MHPAVWKTRGRSIISLLGGHRCIFSPYSPLVMSWFPSLLPTSLDDLVFEGRHQAYGAYQLRQSYRNRIHLSLSIMLSLCALLLGAGLLWQRLHPLAASVRMVPVAPTPPIPPTYVAEAPKPAAPPAPSQPRPAPASSPAAPAAHTLQVVKDEVTTKPLTAEVLLPPTTEPGPVVAGPATGTEPGAGQPGGTDTEPTAGSSEAAPAVTGPYVVVEQMPEFAGGTKALMRYLRSHLRYPGAALAAQAEGRVFVSFVVQADGTIADVAVLKGLGYGLDEEAQRVVRQMPAWAPGRQSHRAVPVRFTLPITFRMQ